MEVPVKRIKLEYCVNLENLPSHIFEKILNYMTITDKKNLGLTNSTFHFKVSKIMKNRTYLYVTKKNEDELSEVLHIKREFCEIFFHGCIKKNNINRILQHNKNRAQKLCFGKNDLNFIKTSKADMLKCLQCLDGSLQILSTLNIEITSGACSNEKVVLPLLTKLRCCDTLLSIIDSPAVIELTVFSTDRLSQATLENVNNYLVRHFTIKKFYFKIFCGDDVDVQNIDFKLDHLSLTHLEFLEFRADPKLVLKILKNQKNLIKLRLEDGYITSEDINWAKQYESIFDEILAMKNIQKLAIEMPTIKLMRKLKTLLNLRSINLNAITHDVREEISHIECPNIKRMCFEGIDLGNKSLTKEDVWSISRNFKNLEALKIDTAPLAVIDCILRNMPKLRELKILRNLEIIRKMKSSHENVKLHPTKLEKIVFEQEDFKTRILPIIKASPELKYVKIYWENKHTPVMTMIVDILESCLKIDLIEFKINGIYAKDDLIPFQSHFFFSFNTRNFEIKICRKNGKIKCCRI